MLGGELERCGTDPMTGFHRDGCCDTDGDDAGVHTGLRCGTEEFLRISVAVGNDLVTPRPEFGFPGLRPGDRLVFVREPVGAGVPRGGWRRRLWRRPTPKAWSRIDLADLQRVAASALIGSHTPGGHGVGPVGFQNVGHAADQR